VPLVQNEDDEAELGQDDTERMYIARLEGHFRLIATVNNAAMPLVDRLWRTYRSNWVDGPVYVTMAKSQYNEMMASDYVHSARFREEMDIPLEDGTEPDDVPDDDRFTVNDDDVPRGAMNPRPRPVNLTGFLEAIAETEEHQARLGGDPPENRTRTDATKLADPDNANKGPKKPAPKPGQTGHPVSPPKASTSKQPSLPRAPVDAQRALVLEMVRQNPMAPEDHEASTRFNRLVLSGVTDRLGNVPNQALATRVMTLMIVMGADFFAPIFQRVDDIRPLGEFFTSDSEWSDDDFLDFLRDVKHVPDSELWKYVDGELEKRKKG
jgi:hypothetical protein